MRMSWLMPEIRIVDSFASRWDARWKLASLTATMMLVGTIDRWPAAAAAFLCACAAALAARLPIAAMAAGIGGVALPALPWFALLPILDSETGAEEAALWLFRLAAVACLGVLLVQSTGMPRLLEAASALPVPRVPVRVAHFAYRFTFVLTGELRRLRIALFARGFRMGTNARTFRTLGAVVGGAIVRSEARAERVVHALQCRGFHGDLPRLTPFRTKASDAAFACLFVFAAAGLALFGPLGTRQP